MFPGLSLLYHPLSVILFFPWELYKAHTIFLRLISAMRVLVHLPALLASLTLLQAAASATRGKCLPVLVSWG